MYVIDVTFTSLNERTVNPVVDTIIKYLKEAGLDATFGIVGTQVKFYGTRHAIGLIKGLLESNKALSGTAHLPHASSDFFF